MGVLDIGAELDMKGKHGSGRFDGKEGREVC